jgi:hypothetical protein
VKAKRAPADQAFGVDRDPFARVLPQVFATVSSGTTVVVRSVKADRSHFGEKTVILSR